MVENIQILTQYIKAYEEENQELINSFLDTNYKYYPPGGGKSMNREERITDEKFFFSAFSEIQTTILDTVIQGDKIACRISMKCRHTGEYQRIQATNKQIIINYMEILLIKHNKIVEEWAEFDLVAIFNQLK